jgi:NADP-dependent 3-hydroxy acid dehydrogenase YdfG
LADRGYFVYLGSRDEERGRGALEKLHELGITNADMLAIDVAGKHSVRMAKKELENKIKALDILINNAGIASEQPQDLATGCMDNLRKIFDTNFFGMVQVTQNFFHY